MLCWRPYLSASRIQSRTRRLEMLHLVKVLVVSVWKGVLAPPFSCKGRASLLAKFVSYCLTLFDPSSIYFMSQQIPAMVLAWASFHVDYLEFHYIIITYYNLTIQYMCMIMYVCMTAGYVLSRHDIKPNQVTAQTVLWCTLTICKMFFCVCVVIFVIWDWLTGPHWTPFSNVMMGIPRA